MAKRTPDEHLTKYVINHYGRLMTRAEFLAYRAFLAEGKIQHGYSPEPYEDARTDDSEAVSLMSQGVERFRLQVRDRILRDHADRVFLNYCPQCGGLAKTARAQQCCWCFHDWHRPETSR
jgi:hypothetical protein